MAEQKPEWIKWAKVLFALGTTAGALMSWYFAIKSWREKT